MKRAQEKLLLQQAKNGDKNAFAMLYREAVQPIYRYIYYRLHDEQLAEDLTGDVFMKALEGLPHYQDQGKPFIAWLYRIAHARVIDEYRRIDRRPDMQDIDTVPVPVEHNMDAPLMQQSIENMLQQVLPALTDEQQQVVILRFVDGLSLEQVGIIMNKKSNAIKALQHRALRTLARELNKLDTDIETILSALN